MILEVEVGWLTDPQPCVCDGDVCTEDTLVYQCPCCLRFVPHCFGASDDMPDLCDDCWDEFDHED